MELFVAIFINRGDDFETSDSKDLFGIFDSRTAAVEACLDDYQKNLELWNVYLSGGPDQARSGFDDDTTLNEYEIRSGMLNELWENH